MPRNSFYNIAMKSKDCSQHSRSVFFLAFALLVWASPVIRSQTAPQLITDLNPGAGGSFASNLTVFGSFTYFSAYTSSTGRELWKYNGDTISLVADINDTKTDLGGGLMQGNDSLPGGFTVFNGALYFSAYDARRGDELWRYDGTQVTRVADINPDANDTIKSSPNSS